MYELKCVRRKQERKCEMTEEMQTKACPYCGEEINVSAIKCKHCGEFLEEKKEEVSGTKVCPFCGEEILASAVKCKHCGEFLNKTPNGSTTSGKFARVDVNDKWKKRFEAIDEQVVDGTWWKYNPNFWKTSMKERWAMACTILFSDFLSTLSAFLFGTFYYLFKGMWLKFLIYSAIILLITYLVGDTGSAFWTICPILAPYDYYRLKVLGKQW